MRDVLIRLCREAAAGRDTVLAVITEATGSAPRKAGSMMLLGAQGRICGTVGGGTVELRSIQRAAALLAEGRSAVERFRLDLGGGPESLGMACGGDVTLLFQYVPGHGGDWETLTAALRAALEAHCPGWLVLGGADAPALIDHTGAALAGDAPTLPTFPGAGMAAGRFFLPLPVGERVVIFGAGHIARALTPLLTTVGFRPVIFDDRPELAVSAAFPAAEVVLCGDFQNISASLTLTPEDYAVVMTHGHQWDLAVETQLLRQELAYVGAIGSRSKLAFVSQKLREAGISEAAIRSVHTPIGTAIKAVTPEEIAVSIAGELIYERALRRERLASEQE